MRGGVEVGETLTHVHDSAPEPQLVALRPLDLSLTVDSAGDEIVAAHTLLMRLRNSRNRSNVSKAFSQVQPLSSMKEPQLFNELPVHV